MALGYRDKLNLVDEAILKNAEFLEGIVSGPGIFGGEDDEDEDEEMPDEPEDEAAEPGTFQQRSGCRAAIAHECIDHASHDGGHGHSHSHDQASHSHSHAQPSHAHSHNEPSHSHSHEQSAHSHSHSHDHSDPSRSHGFHSPSPGYKYKPTEFDMDKLRSTLKQFVRDWSTEGLPEREACYTPMKDALLEHFKDRTDEDKAKLRVLVPGTGLGRLAFDVANLGASGFRLRLLSVSINISCSRLPHSGQRVLSLHASGFILCPQPNL